MKRKILALFLFFVVFISKISAQSVGLQFASMIPSGQTAYKLKPGYGAEFQLMSGEIDDRWKLYFTLGYYKFKPTQDTFKTYGIEESNNGTQLLPGYDVIKKYDVGSAGMGCYFKWFDKKFSPVVGIDGGAAIIVISEDSYTESLIQSSSTNDTYWRFYITPKLGAMYQISDNWLLNAGAGFNMGFGSTGVQSYWKPYLSVNYYFN